MIKPPSPSISLSLHSDVYPDGLPSDYSVIATFKITKETAKRPWDLWQVSDLRGQEQVGLRFQADTRSLDFFYTSPRGSQMLRTFSGVEKLFDGDWHKLALSVKDSGVKLLIDCEEVSVESLDEPRPVIRRGYTSIVKRAVGDRSVSVRWQLLSSNISACVVRCCSRSGCLSLSRWTSSRWSCPAILRRPTQRAAASSLVWWVRSHLPWPYLCAQEYLQYVLACPTLVFPLGRWQCGGYAEIGLTAGKPSCKCMHGQPGVQGPPGPKVNNLHGVNMAIRQDKY